MFPESSLNSNGSVMDYKVRILERIQKAIDYIEENLKNPVKVEELCREACCSLYHFQRLFRAATGVSVAEYIRKRRLTESLADLKTTGKKVIQVAFEYQYGTHESFSKAFFKQFDIAPIDYRKSNERLNIFEKIELEEMTKNFKTNKRRSDMFYELNRDDFKVVKPLFQDEKSKMNLNSVLSGNIKGRIFVDNKTKPLSAVLDIEGFFYLTGKADNEIFNLAFRNVFDNDIRPKSIEGELDRFYFYPDSTEWEKCLESLFYDHSILKNNDTRYKFNKPIYDWENKIPEGYRVTWITKEILNNYKCKHMYQMKLFIRDYWASEDKFIEQKGALCLLNDDTIFSFAFIFLLEGKNCDMGIYTHKDHQNKGYAKIVAAAFTEKMSEQGMTIYSETVKGYIAINKIFSQVGIETIGNSYHYEIFADLLNHNWANCLYQEFIFKSYPKALEYCSKVYEIAIERFGKRSEWICNTGGSLNKDQVYFTYSRLLLKNNLPDKALANLKEGIELNIFSDEYVKKIKEDELGFLKELKEWVVYF